MSSADWKYIAEIVEIVQAPAKFTTLVQSESLTTCEFAEEWIKMSQSVAKIGTDLSKKFENNLKTRQGEMFSNKFILAGWYLNKRVKFLMSEEQETEAKSLIRQVAWKSFKLECGNCDNSLNEIEEINSLSDLHISHDDNDSEEDSFEKFLQSQKQAEMLSSSQSFKEFSQQTKMSQIEQMLQQLDIELSDYDAMRTEDKKQADWLVYWKQQQNLPLMQKIVPIIITVPATEVSVERLFSHLNFILNKLRSSLKGSLLNSILKVRTNKVFGSSKKISKTKKYCKT